VFTFGYVNAMRSTMLLPVILLAVGAVSCLLLKGPQRSPERAPEIQDVPAQEGASAA
jgi:hypothetical protein